MTTYSDDDLTKAGRAALTKVPWAIRRGLGDENTIVFKNKSDKNGVAEVEPGTRIVYIDDPKKFMFSPRQVVAHEATHILQSRLHPTAQAKFPKTNDQNPYGQMNSPNAHLVLQQARQNGKTISDFSREEQGAIVQHYAALQQGLEDAVTSKTLTPDLKNRFNQTLQIYQPYIDDYAKLPMAINEPTSKSQKGINTAPQAPPGPDPSLMHTDVILNTQPPRSSMPLPPNPDASNVVTAPPSPQPQTTSPDMSSATIPQQPQTQFTPPAQAAGMGGPPQITPQLAQNAAIGAAHKSLGQLLMGSSTSYVQTPNGPVPVQTQNKPGQFFRNVLASAIMGGAAGGETNMRDSAGSGWGAAARGAGAARAGFQQQDQQAQQQAQQQFQNQQEVSKADRENRYMDAQLAQMQAQTARWRHEDDLHDQEAHDAHNKAAQVLLNTYTDPKVGGRDPVDAALPGTLSATDLAQKYMENPKIRVSSNPDYVRHFIDTTDASEVNWDGSANAGKGAWVNNTDGTPVNMTDHTQFHVVDVPRDAMQTKVATKGSDLNALEQLPKGTKLYEDDKDYMVSPLDKNAIFQRGQAQALEKAKVDVDERRVAQGETANAREADRQKQEEFASYQRTVAEENQNLRDQAKEETDPAKQASIRQQIAINDAGLAAKQEEIYPAKKGKVSVQTQTTSGGGRTDGGITNDSVVDDQIPPGAQIAVNPTTKVRLYSVDNGKTWKEAPPSNTVGTVADNLRSLSPLDREMALANPKISLAHEDAIRRSLGIDPPDDSKYANDITVQRQIKKMKGVSPAQIKDRLSDFDLSDAQLEAIIRGAKRESVSQ